MNESGAEHWGISARHPAHAETPGEDRAPRTDHIRGGMIGMDTFGILWMALAVVVVIALVVILLRSTSKT